jgi:predicted N-acetyltransferase YhbS
VVSDALQGDVAVRPVTPADLPSISDLHARTFGPGRFVRTAYRVREGTDAISTSCRVAVVGDQLIAAVKFTPILIGGEGGGLLLGPLAVDPAFANRGYGRGLVANALEESRAAGIALVLLVGDEPYYGRLGFRRIPHGRIALPGPVDPDRMLAAELAPGALERYSGLVAAAR